MKPHNLSVFAWKNVAQLSQTSGLILCRRTTTTLQLVYVVLGSFLVHSSHKPSQFVYRNVFLNCRNIPFI